MTVLLANLGAFSTAFAQSDFFGKLILFALLGLSAICWIILLYKIWLTRHVRIISEGFAKACKNSTQPILQWDTQKFPQSPHRQIPHPFGQIFLELKTKTLELLNKNHYFLHPQGGKAEIYLSPIDLEMLENHVLTTISSQKKHLEKNLFVLSTVVTLAPFLGLLGTVWGILVTFAEFNAGGTMSSNTAILGGISTALVTTVLGLVIAIPALVAYNYLRAFLSHYTSEMEDFLYTLLSQIELQYRKVDA